MWSVQSGLKYLQNEATTESTGQWLMTLLEEIVLQRVLTESLLVMNFLTVKLLMVNVLTGKSVNQAAMKGCLREGQSTLRTLLLFV